jgi:protein-disulfide isomerase
MSDSNWQTRLTTLVNIGVILFAFVMLAGRPAFSKWEDWRSHRAQKRAIGENWEELAGAVRWHEAGPAVIVEMGDYQCPACRFAHTMIRGVADELGVSIAYRHNPLSAIHPHAEAAAIASICAEQLGQFSAMHNFPYETEDWMQDPDWPAIGVRAGIADTAGFRMCLSSRFARTRLEQDRRLARAVGVRGTPTFVGPRGVHEGFPSRPILERLLGEAQIER